MWVKIRIPRQIKANGASVVAHILAWQQSNRCDVYI